MELVTLNDVITPVVITIDSDTFTPISSLSILDGVELTLDEGTTCTVSGESCYTDDGDEYVLLNGEIVPADPETNAGSLDLMSLLLLLFSGTFYRAVGLQRY